MTKEQEDYIKLEDAAKEWINETDGSQFEIYELLAMFASKEIEKIFSLPNVNDCKDNEKYNYGINDNWLSDRCKFRNDGTMMGSVICGKCKHNNGINNRDGWIICGVIDKAK